MTNNIAIGLGLLILGGLVADYVYYELSYTHYLAQKLAGLIEYVAFWR